MDRRTLDIAEIKAKLFAAQAWERHMRKFGGSDGRLNLEDEEQQGGGNQPAGQRVVNQGRLTFPEGTVVPKKRLVRSGDQEGTGTPLGRSAGGPSRAAAGQAGQQYGNMPRLNAPDLTRPSYRDREWQYLGNLTRNLFTGNTSIQEQSPETVANYNRVRNATGDFIDSMRPSRNPVFGGTPVRPPTALNINGLLGNKPPKPTGIPPIRPGHGYDAESGAYRQYQYMNRTLFVGNLPAGTVVSEYELSRLDMTPTEALAKGWKFDAKPGGYFIPTAESAGPTGASSGFGGAGTESGGGSGSSGGSRVWGWDERADAPLGAMIQRPGDPGEGIEPGLIQKAYYGANGNKWVFKNGVTRSVARNKFTGRHDVEGFRNTGAGGAGYEESIPLRTHMEHPSATRS